MLRAIFAFLGGAVAMSLTVAGVQMIGQVQGLIDDVPSVAELVQRTLDEARSTGARVAGLTA